MTRSASLAALGAAAFAVGFAAAAALLAAAPAASAGVSPPATGHANVHLVRFLDEVSETDRARFGPLHDIRLRVAPGYVVLVRREGDFAAILPIEARPEASGAPDSLQYFWYLERGPFLWLVPRGHDKGIRVVADGGVIKFNTFTLRWGKGGDRGWLYFPDVPENRGVRVSVVSGNSVDKVDPRSTRYWVELGTDGAGGF
ncbi:MAG TPA: hypothetical protein VFS09_01660 [Candidatus Eisenbacteria bacterium]|nr:hypothetical protein [Candidatus Eisenbacteria bacterium]